MNTYPSDTLKRLQQVELEILAAINQVCTDNNITWFLIGGSALGAMRHQGFIPWDDDIDIGMLRDDYDRFLQIAPKALPDGYILATPNNTVGYAAMFAKVYKNGTKFYTQETIDAGVPQGIFVDVFPFDRVWADAVKRKKQYNQARKYTRLSYLYHSPHISIKFKGMAGVLAPAVLYIAHFLVKLIFNPNNLKKRFNSAAQSCSEEASMGYTSLPHPYSSALPKDVFIPPNLVAFEEYEYPVPANSPIYLADHYDDNWMTLPPEDQRKTHAPLVLDFGDGINAIIP